MPRHQLEAVARRLGIRDPDYYELPQLREAVKYVYRKHKERKRR